jgi:DNA (cytosine-5)-methyltransferase 1
MSAYYNEFDKYAAQWLRNLIAAGHIAPGDVDERSISEVKPADLVGYTQCHFFAGIGGWSLALRLAGWGDDRPVWTGSCPCQPFSVAGQGAGVADERHLWPHWFHLIRAQRPKTVFGEQVDAAIKHGWLDLVQDDMEGEGYAFGAVGVPAASVGAPHIRQRLWFVADSESARLSHGRQGGVFTITSEGIRIVSELGDSERGRQGGNPRWGSGGIAENADSQVSVMGDPRLYGHTTHPIGRTTGAGEVSGGVRQHQGSDSHWSACDWVYCRDGKWRPVEPGTFPLAHGVSNRVGRLRAYGNAIVPQVAAQVIHAYMECRP